jgi:sRNA-binding protein
MDPDEPLTTRLRDLALVELEALTAGLDGARAGELTAAHADDIADALRDARARIAALRQALGGADPLGALDASPRQRASEGGKGGSDRARARLADQAEAARQLARLADLAAGLVPRLFEADRRRP